jgi:hypothetical protein
MSTSKPCTITPNKKTNCMTMYYVGIGGAAFGEGRRMLIMAASNNEKHFHSIPKVTGQAARFLSTYTDKELNIALPYMIESHVGPADQIPTLDEMLSRAKTVGNLPRYLMSILKFSERQKATNEAIKTISTGDLKDLFSFNGFTKDATTIPGTLFKVSVNTRATKPSERHVGLVEVKDSFEGIDTDESVGYDGHLVQDYGSLVLDFMSRRVYRKIVRMNREVILSFWGKLCSDGSRNLMATLVENLFWSDLRDKRQMEFKRFQMFNTTGKDEMKATGKSIIEIFNTGNCTFRKNMKMSDLDEAVFSIKSDLEQVVCRMKKNAALIDFAGPSFSVYQVTISDDHSISIQGLKDLFLASGHCVMDSDGTIVISKNANEIGTIKYHWVVPPEQREKWKKRAPKRIFKKDKDKISDDSFDSLRYCLENYVTQYTLEMEYDPVYLKD